MDENNINIILKNNLLEYRNLLTIPNNINFGLEIELNNTNYDLVQRKVNNKFKNYIVKDDLSLNLGHNAEINTPVYKNTKENWKELLNLSKLIQSIKHDFDGASFQINFDGLLLNDDHKKALFLKFFSYYEGIIYNFSKGYDNEFRENFDMYAYPITFNMKAFINKDDISLIEYFTDKKNYGINYKSLNNLIEVRCPNGTDNIMLWQNYVTFFYYLINYISKYNINEDILNDYILSFNDYDIFKVCEDIDINKSLELSDKIFNNKTDKIYFMKQYLKK